jgi:hypothetical protein
MRRASTALVPSLTLFMLVSAAGQSQSAVTVYTTQASFLAAAPGATLLANFELQATGPKAAFSEGGLSFSSPISLYIIGPALPGTTNPLPATKMLSANGHEDIAVTAGFGWTYAFGFTLLTNRFGPHTAALFDENGVLLLTHQPTQAPNTVGFLGFVGTYPSRIARLRWVADRGQIENTALDNFYADIDAITPARSTSWGRIKSLFR